MTATPYMKFYFADYANDTTHLTTAREHGAYFLLLKAMWSAGGKLPADDRRLARLALCSESEWADIREAILPFFKRRGGVIRHKRIDREMAAYAERSLQASKAGKSSASKKRKEINGKAATDVERSHNQSESESEGRTEPLQGSGSTFDASEPARPDGAVSPRPALRLVAEREPREVRQALVAEVLGRRRLGPPCRKRPWRPQQRWRRVC